MSLPCSVRFLWESDQSLNFVDNFVEQRPNRFQRDVHRSDQVELEDRRQS